MRSKSLVLLLAVAVPSGAASAVDVRIVLEARGLGSQVQWSQIANGFTLDVFLEGDTAMTAAGITLMGDAGFHHAGTVTGDFGVVQNYATEQGWSALASDAQTFAAGNLPLTGGVGAEAMELGTIATNAATGAASGLFAWLEFTEVPADGSYVIEPGERTHVGDLDFQPMNIVSITPLTIQGSTPGNGGGGGGGDGGGDGDAGGDGDGGDDGSGDDGDGGTVDGDGGGDGGTGGSGDGDIGGDNGNGDDDAVDDGGDGGGVILPPDDGGEEAGTTPVGAAPLCGAAAVEAMMLSLASLFVVQRRRRRR